jgi:methyltransferase-like protein 23
MDLSVETFSVGHDSITLYVPAIGSLKKAYLLEKQKNPSAAFPYWAQVWPSALALSEFITTNPFWVKDKKVLELAAGLGLPGLIAARYAAQVCISDYLPAAVAVQEKTVAHLQLKNVSCCLLNWNRLPTELTAEVVLLSDINYDPASFDKLFEVIQDLLQKGATILLSTPQRLMAKPFAERLLPFCLQQEEIQVPSFSTMASVLVLQKKV